MEIARIIAGRTSGEVVTVASSLPVRDAVALLAERRIGAVPVVDDGAVVGIFSERDVLYCLAKEGPAFLDRNVGDVMTAPAITVHPSTVAVEALALMTRRRVRHLPVCSTEGMCGFVSIGDLVKSRIDEIQQEAEAMRIYIQQG